MAHEASLEGRVRASRAPIPTWYFALVIVRRGHRFLLTQERKYGATWSIPGGRVEPGGPVFPLDLLGSEMSV